MILLSPEPPAGPVGTPLAAPLEERVDFLTPPTGAAVVVAWVLAALETRLRVPRRAPPRRVLRISSRDWSSFPDMMTVIFVRSKELSELEFREMAVLPVSLMEAKEKFVEKRDELVAKLSSWIDVLKKSNVGWLVVRR